jgi:hypothetical protein
MPSSKRKRSNPSTELLKIKKNYYVKKETILEEKTEICGTESLQIKREKLDLYKKKNQLDERRVNALEECSVSNEN